MANIEFMSIRLARRVAPPTDEDVQLTCVFCLALDTDPCPRSEAVNGSGPCIRQQLRAMKDLDLKTILRDET